MQWCHSYSTLLSRQKEGDNIIIKKYSGQLNSKSVRKQRSEELWIVMIFAPYKAVFTWKNYSDLRLIFRSHRDVDY